MSVHYEHTQRGIMMIAVLFISALIAAAAAYANTGSARWIGAAIALGVAISALLFSSPTVIVNDNELRWYFGPGAWRYGMALGDIETARVVRNSWLNGFGIRMRPGFRL